VKATNVPQIFSTAYGAVTRSQRWWESAFLENEVCGRSTLCTVPAFPQEEIQGDNVTGQPEAMRSVVEAFDPPLLFQLLRDLPGLVVTFQLHGSALEFFAETVKQFGGRVASRVAEM